jgi:hypothetical protein
MKVFLNVALQYISRTILFFSLFISISVSGQVQPHYIFINTAPGKSYKVGKPSTFTPAIFNEIKQKINAPVNAKMQLGISVIIDYLGADLDSVEKSLDRLLVISKETKTPVLIHLDGINWLNARPDLWNWWDPKKPGYNPKNRQNVEWTGWDESSAIKVSWRNWGAQFRILPAPNLASPAIIHAQVSALNRLVPRIVSWYHSLPANEKYLLGGVKLGHEVSIGVNAYYYKNGNRYIEQMPRNTSLDPQESYNAEAGFTGGLAPIGYAAVKTAGIKDKGRITAKDIEEVVFLYLDTICKTAYQLGLPANLIYTHQGGTFAPWDKHLSFAAASNAYSLPGWSFYGIDPNGAGDLGDVLDRRKQPGWAAPEWWWPGNNKNEWIYHLHRTLAYKGCRFLAIFNWENGLERYPDGIEAVREVIADWKE